MRTSKAIDCIKFAADNGYHVTKDGTVLGMKGSPLTTSVKKGYLQFGVYPEPRRNGKQHKVWVAVHRLQAFQKFGEDAFQEGIVTRHLNGVKTDNSWDNIEIGTDKDNALDIPEDLRRSRALPCAKKKRQFTDDEVRYIRELRATGLSFLKIAKEMGCDHSVIYSIHKGKTYYTVKD